jgi:DNA (cytosine-5)-methyltransferase 1
MDGIRSFDLFCGAGGSSLGAKSAGATSVGGVDLWEVATQAFAANLPGAKPYTSNLLDLDPVQVAQEVGRIDLLLASPECTNHSIAKGNKPRSEESKQLAYQVIRFANAMQPRWIVVENVVQMERWNAFADWLQKLHDLGYQTLIKKLDAERYGVPQNRRRLFVICDRQAAPREPTPSRKRDTSVHAILRKAKRGDWSFRFTPLENGRRAKNTVERAQRGIDAVGYGNEFIMVYYGSDAAGGFQTLDRPLRTVTTLDRFAYMRPNCKGYEMRMLQPSELMPFSLSA